jgi:ribosomal subunit interface protein
MQVAVLGPQRFVPDHVRELAAQKVGRLGRHATVLEEAEVRLVPDNEHSEPRLWSCSAVLRGHGHELYGHARAAEPLGAVDAVVEKLDHQVARLKGKLIGRSHPRHED